MKTLYLLLLFLIISIYPIRAVHMDERSVFEMGNSIDTTFQRQGESEQSIAEPWANSGEEQALQQNTVEEKFNTINQLLITQICMCIAITDGSDSQLNFMGNMFIEIF